MWDYPGNRSAVRMSISSFAIDKHKDSSCTKDTTGVKEPCWAGPGEG